MSYNKFGEQELAHIVRGEHHYYISRDRSGLCVLRSESSDGKEMFSPTKDDGKKNTKRGRVENVCLLYDVISGLDE